MQDNKNWSEISIIDRVNFYQDYFQKKLNDLGSEDTIFTHQSAMNDPVGHAMAHDYLCFINALERIKEQ